MYNKIVNPETGSKVNVTSKLGKKIIKNYLNIVHIGGFREGWCGAEEYLPDHICITVSELNGTTHEIQLPPGANLLDPVTDVSLEWLIERLRIAMNLDDYFNRRVTVFELFMSSDGTPIVDGLTLGQQNVVDGTALDVIIRRNTLTVNLLTKGWPTDEGLQEREDGWVERRPFEVFPTIRISDLRFKLSELLVPDRDYYHIEEINSCRIWVDDHRNFNPPDMMGVLRDVFRIGMKDGYGSESESDDENEENTLNGRTITVHISKQMVEVRPAQPPLRALTKPVINIHITLDN